MLYHVREIAQAGLAPARAAADLTGRLLRHPDNPWRDTPAARWLAAGCEVFDNLTRRYENRRSGLVPPASTRWTYRSSRRWLRASRSAICCTFVG